MQQTMEMLSLVTTPASDGQRVRTNRKSSGEGFTQVFEQELGRDSSRNHSAGRRESRNPEHVRRPEENKIALDEDLDGVTQTAAVMHSAQNEVVFILEGNDGTVTAYGQDVEEILPQTISSEEIQTQPPAKNINETPQEFIQKLNEEIAAAKPEQTDIRQVVETQKAETITTNQAGTVSVEANNITQETEISKPIAASEVEARMPEIMTEDQENTGNMSSFSENDNLSPLENENGSNRAEKQSETTYPGESVVRETETTNETLTSHTAGIRPEQFRAAQQMAEVTQSLPVKPENLFQELVQRVELMQSEAKSAMTITLNPEHLGNVALEVAIDAAGLHVKISAEDSGVRGIINSQLTALIESLQSKGIAVAGVEVAYTAMEYNHSAFKGNQDGGRKSGSQSQQGKNREIDTKDGGTYYTTLPDIMDYYMDTGVSSVEFSA